MEFDFGGYATKNNLRCSDGRTILKNAFAEQHGTKVPLVWQHMHDDPANVLGHAILENRDDGVYAYCSLNDSPGGQNARTVIEHGDVDSLSIWANDLTQRGGKVIHGSIKEVSLVLAGANPGAHIDNLSFQHSDGSVYTDDSEAIIHMGILFDLDYEDENDDDGYLMHADGGDKTVGDVVNSMTDEQKNVMYALIAAALEEAAGAGSNGQSETAEHSDITKGGNKMKKNVFMTGDDTHSKTPTLSHAQFKEILDDAQKCGSFKESFLAHTQSYGIENIELLFPDAKNVTNPPDFIKRRTEWVNSVINGAKHSPFSRIKTMTADITADEARARGYIKGNKKVEEVFPLLQRITTPTTIYKKQKLDRDDIIDITDLDVVAWIKKEMRMMLDEEIARAVLLGDGRPALTTDGKANPDKINESNIRPIWKEDDLYAPKVQLDSGATVEEIMEGIVRAMDEYEGSGSPTMFCTQSFVTDMLLLRDKMGRRLYSSESEITNFLGVSNIVKVPLMKDLSREDKSGNTLTLKAILVNMSDYTIGADKGGQISMFDDFDIDYNQYKYLLETRISGCLIHPKTAVIVEQKKATTPITPTTPTAAG